MSTSTETGKLFGLPLGDFGWFASLLVGFASGFAAFFASTFLAIMSLLAYITVTGRPANSVDFALAYRRVGFPVGVTVLVFALGYLGSVWIRRKVTRGE